MGDCIPSSGLRYDRIKVDSAFRKVLLHGYDTGVDDGK